MATELTTQNPDQPSPISADERALGIVLDEGEPFQFAKGARSRLKELGLGNGWEIGEYGAGFAIMRKIAAEPEEQGQEPDVPVVAPWVETFKWVKFHSKSNPMDPDEVILACNGEVLQIRRNERIPLPGRFLEIADHCRYPHFTQEPGKDRKVDREIHKYPYDILGEATLQNFTSWKKAGTKATREHAERSGISLEG